MLDSPSAAGSWECTRRSVAVDIAKCMRYLHFEQRHPLVHRDIKPANILISDSGAPKVADFGESTRFDDELAIAEGVDALTMTMVGTPAYCAPGKCFCVAVGRVKRYCAIVAAVAVIDAVDSCTTAPHPT